MVEPTHCAKTGCKTTRLHPDCLRHMCRRHCAEAGGCHAKGHSAIGPISASSSRHEKTTIIPPTTPSSPRESSVTTASTSKDLFADPRYASQMTAAFTKHYALEQDREELRRAADTERLANIDKAKHHVVIYAWPKVRSRVREGFFLLIMFQQDNVEATVVEVQGGFKWPHFALTPSVLSQAELSNPDETMSYFKLYNTSIHTWSKVQVGHVITLKAGDHIFLKGRNVTHCPDFDRLFTGQLRAPHFSNNLQHERAHVRHAMKERQMGEGKAINSKPKPEFRAPSSVLSGRRFSSSTQGSGPPRIDLTISDNDDDMTPYAGRLLARRHKIKLEPETTDVSQPVKVKSEPMFVDLTISDPEDHHPPGTVTRKRKRSRSPSLHATSESSDEDHMWPTDFHVVDVVKGFDKCLKASRTHKSVEEAFFECFGVPFKSSTFYRHRRKWERASEASREKALRAGHTSAGLWSAFIARSEAEGRKQKRFKV